MYRPKYEDCAKHFDYDPETGVIRWKIPTSTNVLAGAVAGSLNSSGYRRVSFKGGIISQHRLAWLLHYGSWPSGEIDHINRDRKDNRIKNLRVVTRSENARNRRFRSPGEMRHGGTGVCLHKKTGKWQVQVHCPEVGRAVYGGLFAEKADALQKAALMRGEKAK